MPFNGTSNSNELFEHASLRHAEKQLREGISRGAKLLLLSAERGTGKTVLLQLLHERLEQDGFEVCSLAASVSLGELRGACDRARGLEEPLQAAADSSHRSIGTILAGATADTPVVLLVDDAEVLNTDVLRSLVELAGSGSAPQRWLRIVLAGTPNLISRLRDAGAGEFIERAATQAFLAPLGEDEVGEYVARKLEVAGATRQTLFDQAVIRELSRCSGGLPRRIDTLCGMALLIAYDNGKHRLEPAMVAEAVNDLEGDSGDLRSRFEVESDDDSEPTDWSAVPPSTRSKAVAEEPRPSSAEQSGSRWLPAWRAAANTMQKIPSSAGRVIRQRWRALWPSRRRTRDKSSRYGTVTQGYTALGGATSRQERDWLGLKASLVGLFAVAVVAVLVGVIALDRPPAAPTEAITQQALSALRDELRNVRTALAEATAAKLESERIIAEQQVLLSEYQQQSAGLKTELANKLNRSPVRLTLPRDVVLTVRGADGRQLRIEPAQLHDREVETIVLAGDVDLRNISPLLAVAEPVEGQPEQSPRPPGGPRPTPSEALQSAFEATSVDHGRTGETTAKRPAADSATKAPPPTLAPEPDPSHELPVAATNSTPEPGDTAVTADQIAAIVEREPPAAGMREAAQQTASVATSPQGDDPALPEEQPRPASGDAPATAAETTSASWAYTLPVAAEPQSVSATDSPPLTTALAAPEVQLGLAPMEDKSTYPAGAKPSAQNAAAQKTRPAGRVTETDATPSANVSASAQKTSTGKSRGALQSGTSSSQPKGATAQTVTPVPVRNDYVEYQVVAGDTLFAIAKRLGVTIADLREWNRLTTSRLKPGQTLRIVDASTRDPATDSKLLTAAELGERQAVMQALDGGASLDARNEENRTALMLAAGRGHLGVVRLLLDRGAPADTSDELVGSALAYAAWNGHAQIVAELLDRGSKMEVTNRGGWTPLIYAAINGHVQCVRQLLEHGADADARNLEGRTALSAAVWNRHTGVARALLDAGADVNTKTRDGWTPLLDAAVNGDAAMVSLLLSFGADPATESEAGMTALAIAEQRGNEDVVKAFSQARPSSS